ncbi:AT-rich interactive domain-containing protein 2 [Branchiostoma belcheri]|nr:AT-rich interactive domain-containing protein 2 [Branchiostoma belcheri]
MSGAPEVVMISDTGQWWIWKEDGKVALVNVEDGLGTIEDVWKQRRLAKIKLELGPPTKLAVRNFDTEATSAAHPRPERRSWNVLYVERTTVEGSSVTEATTLAPEEADSGVVKRHFVGKFEIPVDRTVSPHWAVGQPLTGGKVMSMKGDSCGHTLTVAVNETWLAAPNALGAEGIALSSRRSGYKATRTQTRPGQTSPGH